MGAVASATSSEQALFCYRCQQTKYTARLPRGAAGSAPTYSCPTCSSDFVQVAADCQCGGWAMLRAVAFTIACSSVPAATLSYLLDVMPSARGGRQQRAAVSPSGERAVRKAIQGAASRRRLGTNSRSSSCGRGRRSRSRRFFPRFNASFFRACLETTL